jgi:hypothetical protein
MRMYESGIQLGHVGPEHSGGICRDIPLCFRTMPVSPLCEMSVNEKTVRGCIGSSGNVRVFVWLRYRSLVMEYGESCIPGRMGNLPTIPHSYRREALV